MQALIDNAVAIFKNDWFQGAMGVVLFVLGRWWGQWRQQRSWRRREFFNRVNISLNALETVPGGGKRLLIRTLRESPLEAVFANQSAQRQVLAAAKGTSEENPLLEFEPGDAWFVLNDVLNHVAEVTAAGQLRRDMGLAVRTHRYLLCLTHEPDEEVRTRKVRALLVRKDHLLAGAFDEGPQLESSNHATRIRTLRLLRERFEVNKERFIEMEVALPED